MNLNRRLSWLARALPSRSNVALRLALAILPLTGQAQVGITDLGTLGGSISWAYGISADGSVVVGGARFDASGSSHAYRWTQSGGMTDLGTLGGTFSASNGVSADGSVVVGYAYTGAETNAFRWTQAGGMVNLGTLGGTASQSRGVSADGSVVVGRADLAGNAAYHAFRWTQAGGMSDMGTLGGTNSKAWAASSDGSVVVGGAQNAGAAWRAFRWTQAGGMADLGTLGGGSSDAYGTSNDGSVVVGYAYTAGNAAYRAFRWTQSNGMVNLGTLGGTNSLACGVSGDGAVVVGYSWTAGNAVQRAFRWTQASGNQTVEDWLRSSGVAVPADITQEADATNSDGSVVVGSLSNGHAFIARATSGLVTLSDVQDSLQGAATGGNMALSAVGTVLNGAHSRPQARRVAEGRKTVWVAGDIGRDDHGTRTGDMGLAEVGGGVNFGLLQLNVSVGQTWAKQNLVLSGHAKSDGTYLMAEMLIPVTGSVFATVGGYINSGKTDLRRGYINAGTQDYSTGRPNVDTRGLRARVDWEDAAIVDGVALTPFADLGVSLAKMDAYTETGGGFPARFDARKEKATEFRFGANAVKPLANDMRLVGGLEATHRAERSGARTVGQVIGLFGFDLAGEAVKRNWLRGMVGMEGKFGDGVASLSFNATTKGQMPNAWLAANWQMTF